MVTGLWYACVEYKALTMISRFYYQDNDTETQNSLLTVLIFIISSLQVCRVNKA
jgi:hypothetical protein